MKKILIPLVALTCCMMFAQTPVKQTVQAKGPDGFFGPVIPNKTQFVWKQQIIEEVKEYVKTNVTDNVNVTNIVESELFRDTLDNKIKETVTVDFIKEITGTNTITESEAQLIITNTATIKLQNAQFISGFEEITNVVIKQDMTVEELKIALIKVIGGIQKSLGGATNVVIRVDD